MGTAICYNWKFGRCANVNALMKDGELTGVGKNFKIWSKKQVVPEHAYFLVLTAVFWGTIDAKITLLALSAQ